MCLGYPVDAAAAAALRNISQVAVGPYSTVVRVSGGKLACIGDYTICDAIPAGVTGVTDVAVGSAACLVNNGKVSCYVLIPNPDEGDPRPGLLNVPAGLSGVSKVVVGSYHACALLSANGGSLVCWGANYYNAVDGAVGLTGVVQVSIGRATCALKSDGVTVCWGSINTTPTPRPTLLPKVSAIAASNQGVCGIAVADGAPVCEDQINGGVTRPLASGLTGATAITAGWEHYCTVINGALYCWGGQNYSGEAPPGPIV